MADFGTPPAKGKSMRAVLDEPSAGPATLENASGATAQEKKALFDPAAGAPPDGASAVADALQSISPESPEDILKRICPMCGWDQTIRNAVEPSEEDKNDFVRAAVSGGRFRKVYPCYGGRVKITMRSRTYAETEAVMTLVEHWRKRENVEAANVIIFKTYAYQALFSLERLELEGKEPKDFPALSTTIPAPPEDSSTPEQRPDIEKAEQYIKEEFSEITWQSIQNAARHFDQLTSFLTLRAHDPNFWNGIATPA